MGARAASRGWSVAVCAVAISGCAHYEPAPIVPAQSAAALESRGLADPALRAFIESNPGHALPEWPLKTWNLELLTLAAFYYSPELDVARARWDAANAAVATAGGRPNPALNLVPTYSTNPPLGVSHFMPSIGLDVPIETAGKRGHRILEARQSAEAARLNVVGAAWQVRRILTGALLDYAVARNRASLLQRQFELQEQAMHLKERELAAGAVAGSDVTAVRVQVAKTRLDIEAARAEGIEARARCADALGVPLRALDAAELQYDFGPADATALASEDARRRALQERSDVLASLAQYEATQAALQLEIAKQYPDVHLGPGYAWTEGENLWSLGLAFELPVLNRNQGPIAEAAAHRKEAGANFTVLQAKVIHEVDTAVAALKAADDGSLAAEKLLATQRRILDATQAQRRAGEVGALETVAAQIDVVNTESLAFEADVRRHRALRALEDAVQRPLGSEGDARLAVLQIESTQRPPR